MDKTNSKAIAYTGWHETETGEGVNIIHIDSHTGVAEGFHCGSVDYYNVETGLPINSVPRLKIIGPVIFSL